VKKYCQAAGIDPNRLGERGIGVHSLPKAAINDAIRNGTAMHGVREFAGHSDIRSLHSNEVLRQFSQRPVWGVYPPASDSPMFRRAGGVSSRSPAFDSSCLCLEARKGVHGASCGSGLPLV
jgi:hypothetical protein